MGKLIAGVNVPLGSFLICLGDSGLEGSGGGGLSTLCLVLFGGTAGGGGFLGFCNETQAYSNI